MSTSDIEKARTKALRTYLRKSADAAKPASSQMREMASSGIALCAAMKSYKPAGKTKP